MGSNLNIAQIDIDCASPPGWSELMVLSLIRRAYLVANCAEVGIDHVSPRLVSPRLTVLPLGWNWSLFFCQAAVEEEIWAAGVESAALVPDRQLVQGVESSLWRQRMWTPLQASAKIGGG